LLAYLQIAELYSSLQSTEPVQQKISSSLDYVETQQQELSLILDSYEKQVGEILGTGDASHLMGADAEREKACVACLCPVDWLTSV
jgi:nuclear pore complex protein Nup62